MAWRTRTGGVLWIACLQYFVAEAVCIAFWRGAYSLRENFISDLGAVRRPVVDDGFSPLHLVMNGSFVLQGALIAVGALLLAPARPRGRLGGIGWALVGASGLGLALVGLAPEDVSPPLHYFGAGVDLVCCNLGALLGGVALLKTGTGSRIFAGGAVLTGAVGLTALALLALRADFGAGIGVVERIAAYPFTLWIAAVGARRLAVEAQSAGTSWDESAISDLPDDAATP